jgi:cytochrome P450
MSPLIPPLPVRPAGKTSLFHLLRLSVKSSLSLFFEESFGVDIGRVAIPTLPWLKRRWVFTVREPELSREVLVRQAQAFRKSDIMDSMMRDVTGDSLFTTDGETWLRQRRLMDPAFAQVGLRAAFPMMRQACDEALDRLADQAARTPDQPADIDTFTAYYAADVIFRAIFSKPINPQDAGIVFAAFEVFQKISFAQGMLKVARYPARLVPGARRAKAAARKIRAVMKAPLDQRLAAIAAGEPTPEADVLAVLLRTRDPVTGQSMSDTELLDQITFLFLAGHETSASALAWSLYLIAACPHVQQRLQAEATAVLGEDEVQLAHIKKLPFAQDVFRETLRLYPPVAFFARDVVAPICLGSREIEPGAMMVVAPWLLQRKASHWHNPHAFDPDRFQTPEGQAAARCAYIPFSAGDRVCVGAGFAMQEATLLIAEVVRRFELSPEPGHTPEPVARLTLRSGNGVRLRVKARR